MRSYHKNPKKWMVIGLNLEPIVICLRGKIKCILKLFDITDQKHKSNYNLSDNYLVMLSSQRK